MFNELYWVSKRALLVVALLISSFMVLAFLHLPNNLLMLLAIVAFGLAHLWLLAWLTFKLQLMYHNGELVSVQLRWRESNRVFAHFWLNRQPASFINHLSIK